MLLQRSGTVGRGVPTAGRGVTRGRLVVALVVALVVGLVVVFTVAGVGSFRAVGSEIIAKVSISDLVTKFYRTYWIMSRVTTPNCSRSLQLGVERRLSHRT